MTKIMVVDDEPDILYTTMMLLEEEGYDVVACRNGEECLSNIREEKPDTILLDIRMWGEDGWEICKKIKEDVETSHIPVIMFSVHSSEAFRTKSLQYANADAHIDKPFRTEELLKTIDEILKKSKSRG